MGCRDKQKKSEISYVGGGGVLACVCVCVIVRMFERETARAEH